MRVKGSLRWEDWGMEAARPQEVLEGACVGGSIQSERDWKGPLGVGCSHNERPGR